MPIDLSRYLSRIGFSGPLAPDLATLRALHLAHATHIPFENLDTLLGRPIRLDLDSLQAKLVEGRRGGWCFEQNGLFTAVLEQIGFKLTRLSARVRLFSNRLMPRTHMLFMVELERERWIGDVGFGGWGLLEPIPLAADQGYFQYGWTMRLRREGDLWVLRCDESPPGIDQYAFSLDPQLPVDYEPPNHYCSTHPDSRFVQTLTAQMSAKEVRYVLRNNEFMTFTPGCEKTVLVESNEGLLQILEERFGLSFPPGTVFGPAAQAMQGAKGT